MNACVSTLANDILSILPVTTWILMILVCSVLVGISGSYWHQKFGRRWRILLAKTCYLVVVSTCRTMSPATQQRCSVIISIIASGAITLWIENTLDSHVAPNSWTPAALNTSFCGWLSCCCDRYMRQRRLCFRGQVSDRKVLIYYAPTVRLSDRFFDVWAGWTRVN